MKCIFLCPNRVDKIPYGAVLNFATEITRSNELKHSVSFCHYLFFRLKDLFGGKCFESDVDLHRTVTTYLNTCLLFIHVSEEFDIQIQNSFEGYDKCLTVQGVEN